MKAPRVVRFSQTVHSVRVAPRNFGLDAPPEGLEAFFCPCLPASGRCLCACSPPDPERRRRGGRRAGDSSRKGCFGAGLSPPAPRLFTFAAPGRSGGGIFYGACLVMFR